MLNGETEAQATANAGSWKRFLERTGGVPLAEPLPNFPRANQWNSGSAREGARDL